MEKNGRETSFYCDIRKNFRPKNEEPLKKYYAFGLLICLTSMCSFFLSESAWSAAAPCDPWIAKMESVQGQVEFLRSGQTQWQRARLNDTYCTGDRIQVGPNSRADVYLINQSIIRLDQNSTITLGGLKEERASLLQLLSGTLYFFSRLPRNLEILTAFVNAGVEGTEAKSVRPAFTCWRRVRSGGARQSARFGSSRAASRRRPVGIVLPAHSLFPPR
jgi:hypothetical protein